MTWFIFILCALAVYRVADILADEEGPAAIFTKLRRKVPRKTNAGRGVRCPYCVGTWTAILATTLLWWIEAVPTDLAVPYAFGLAGAQAALRKVTG